MSPFFVTLGIIAAVSIYAISLYNKGVTLRNYVREAFSTMDVYLKKRWDLIPNLIESVKGYMEHEKGLLNQLTDLRTKNYSQMSNEEKLQANAQIGRIMPKFLAVAENYPNLRASENFSVLMNNLSSVEEDIANARKYYNGTVRSFNTFTEVFPSNIICGFFGFKPEKLFEIDDSERQNVKVKF